jgi:hypothetical protein
MSVVRVKSQLCHGISQYDRCSTNTACGCFHMTGATDTGICGFLYGPCSELVACETSNNFCYQPNHICVNHPRCYSHPVCYPTSMIDQRICPPITSKRQIVIYRFSRIRSFLYVFVYLSHISHLYN